MVRIESAGCGFRAEPAPPGQVIELYYTRISDFVYEGSEGEPVAGLGDGARWDIQLSNSLLVKTGSTYFSIQAVAMGDLPDSLQPRDLAIDVARMVLAGPAE